MIKGNNKSGLFVDTDLLRDHVSKLREEKKMAISLYESVSAMKRTCDPTVSYQYDSVLRDIEQLMEYFGAMADLLDNIADDAIRLSHELHALIEESTATNRHIISDNYLL